MKKNTKPKLSQEDEAKLKTFDKMKFEQFKALVEQGVITACVKFKKIQPTVYLDPKTQHFVYVNPKYAHIRKCGEWTNQE
jgi:hypothetical protein